MRILVYPHLMEIGGSQLNAIELANGVAGQGHDIVLFAPDGELISVAERMDFEIVRAPTNGAWPSPRNIRLLNRIAAERDIDLLHAYEWGPAVEIAYGPHRSHGIPMVTTVLSMSVPDFLPVHEPIIVGTAELESSQRMLRRRSFLLEPPIDTDSNAPESDARMSRTQFGFASDVIVVAVICRLSTDLDKLQGVLQAISVIDRLARAHPVRLLVAGDGRGLPEVRRRTNAVNLRHGRNVVVVTGPLVDPRPAYSAADVVIGMGSSVMKGMAFAKPVVVQGASGFWKTLDDSTLPVFLKQGWYGHGGRGELDLEFELARLVCDADERSRLGSFGRNLVVSRFSLRRAIDVQIEIYERTISDRPSAEESARSLRRTAVELAKFKLVRASHRMRTRARRTP